MGYIPPQAGAGEIETPGTHRTASLSFRMLPPVETKLFQVLEVNGTTVREVLHLLKEGGIVLRRQGLGT